jgi:hypothetical protein
MPASKQTYILISKWKRKIKRKKYFKANQETIHCYQEDN